MSLCFQNQLRYQLFGILHAGGDLGAILCHVGTDQEYLPLVPCIRQCQSIMDIGDAICTFKVLIQKTKMSLLVA